MALMTDIGPKLAAGERAVSSLAYTPALDREFRATRILILNPSANDSWTVVVGTREIMRFYLLTTGNQQFNGGIYGNTYRARDIFTWHYRTFGEHLAIPVPRGQSITVSSVGGATADVIIFGEDLTVGSVSPADRNHYSGASFRLPIYAYVNASVTGTTAQEVPFDTEVRPAWFKNYAIGNPFQASWRMTIRALWMENVSVNTFSGAANHVSRTHHLALSRDGVRLFSHLLSGQVSGGFGSVTTVPSGNLVSPSGIPLFTADAAAGSANTGYGQNGAIWPAFQVMSEEPQSLIDPPLLVNPGDVYQWYLGITGDATGGAAYSSAVLAMLVDIQGA